MRRGQMSVLCIIQRRPKIAKQLRLTNQMKQWLPMPNGDDPARGIGEEVAEPAVADEIGGDQRIESREGTNRSSG